MIYFENQFSWFFWPTGCVPIEGQTFSVFFFETKKNVLSECKVESFYFSFIVVPSFNNDNFNGKSRRYPDFKVNNVKISFDIVYITLYVIDFYVS